MSNEHDDQQTAYLREMHDFDQHEAKYKDLLGSALLAFNRVESMIADMIATVLRARGREDLIGKLLENRPFVQQLEALELLMSSMQKAPRLPIKRLKAIAIKRNEFAHGYLTGSINTGELYIESRAQTTPWDPEKVPPFVKECAAVRDELDALWPYVAFGDTPAKLPPGAISIPD